MKNSSISNNVIRRLPRYLRKLDDMIYHGVERISSNELGAQMGLTPSQIRQDFSCFGEFGQQGYGYNVKALREAIAKILGMNRQYSIILVGIGRIGHSLIANFDFDRYGFRVESAFEIRKDLVGTKIGDIVVRDAEEQDAFIRENNIDIAIVSVPKRSAQRVTDSLIASGIKAIWNFTDVEVDTHDSGVKIENIHFSDSLLALSYYMSTGTGSTGE